MNLKNTFLTIIAGVMVTMTANAQTKFYLDGTGRAVIQSDAMDKTSGILAGDTVGNVNSTDVRATSGYALFDLGANIEKGDKFKAIADLRVRNEFGLFYGEGASLEFRRMLLEGIIGKGVKYEIGDIDVKMTPFTVYNNSFMDNGYEADVFQIRREVLAYENFNNGNNWRLQGAQTYGKVLFAKGIESVAFKGFAARTNKTDYNISPDKVMVGANATIDQGSIIKLGINYNSMLDVPLESTTVGFKNNVISFAPEIGYDFGEDLRLAILGEYAMSSTEYDLSSNDSLISLNGSALNAKFQVVYNPFKLKFNAGFRSVTTDFVSPGSQTRRVNYQATARQASTFGTYYVSNTDGTDIIASEREINLYDRLTQESVYNQAIASSLMAYNPIYGNVDPYGLATPNRTGIYVELEHGDEKSPFTAKVNFNSLSEIESTNGDAYREYTVIGAGLKADFKKLFSMKKEANLVLGYNSESTSRGGTTELKLDMNVINAGITIEVANKLDLLVGAKLFAAKGSEMSYNYESYGGEYTLNHVVSENGKVEFDVNEQMISAGLRARFSEKSFVTLNYNMITYADAKYVSPVSLDYATSQWYMNYTIKF